MITLLIIVVSILHLYAGWYAYTLIKKRDSDAPIAVAVILMLHGFLSLLTTWTIQSLLFPDEDGQEKTIFLRDGMTLDLNNPEHQEIFNKLKEINKK